MTSNIGSPHLLEGIDRDAARSRESARDAVMRELRPHFRPEFLNRVDDIVLFTPAAPGGDRAASSTCMTADLRKRLADREHRARAHRAGARADRPRGLRPGLRRAAAQALPAAPARDPHRPRHRSPARRARARRSRWASGIVGWRWRSASPSLWPWADEVAERSLVAGRLGVEVTRRSLVAGRRSLRFRRAPPRGPLATRGLPRRWLASLQARGTAAACNRLTKRLPRTPAAAPSGTVDANAFTSGHRVSGWRARVSPWSLFPLASRPFVAATVSPACRSGDGMRTGDFPVTTRAPLWSTEAAIRFALAAGAV